MASAKPIFEDKPKVPDGLVLTLDRKEAEVLRAVLSRIAGDAAKGRRSLTDHINYVIRDAGFQEYNTSDFEGNIYINCKE